MTRKDGTPRILPAPDVYRVGGATHRRWEQDYAAAADAIERYTFTDDEGLSWINHDAPPALAKLYCDLQSLGYYHGWMERAA